MTTQTHTAPTGRKPNMAAARRVITAAKAYRVIVESGFVIADSKVGADAQTANLNAALDALDAAGIAYERDAEYPTWLAHLV